MSSEYDDSIWQQIPAGGREPEPWLAARARDFAAAAGSALDLGCGDGVHLPVLVEVATRVSGADRSAVALGRAAEVAPGVTLYEVNADERLPIADNSFDRIWCAGMIEHVVDTQVVLSEARRVLRPGGSMLIVTPDHPLRLRVKLALGGWDDHFDPFSPHLRFYTARSLGAALRDCGFEPPLISRRSGQLIAVAKRL